MKRSLILSFILILIISSVKTYSQCNQGDVITFQKVYGGNGNERAHSVKQTSDGGYVVVGETTSFGAGGKDWFVLKIDANGVEQWTKTYGTSSTDDGNSISIIETSDGGYLIAGHTNNQEAYVLKIDITGNIQWDRKNANAVFRGVRELANGDVILIGNEYSFGTGGIAIFAIRLSSLGFLVWSNAYGTVGNEQAYTVVETPSGDLIFSTGTSSFGTSDDCLLMKTDPLGNVIWSKRYGG